jgi:hypothetical protein
MNKASAQLIIILIDSNESIGKKVISSSSFAPESSLINSVYLLYPFKAI